ncbi:D-alanine-D-alanine ligase [Aminobacter lissarensis]|uniref:D-alanine-D-alanine ligase n=1 Tax=Aminobacter carboxidus TaxID=376165 RepID=A0A8E1WCV7_9HYPH|nr:D-alanine:D-lactate ligase-like protein [Aminobacter lissarensis]MBB6466052.1 D-alanine-D-alanine ligase [Aminobacter lissarensis]
MAGQRPTLILVHEPERACLEHLLADGFSRQAAMEISSYLAQSTDMDPEFCALADACTERGLDFRAVVLDDAATVLASADRSTSLVWTLTDGIAYFRGGASPALARLNGLRTIGADDSLFALCQDKFRAGAVLTALGLPVPAAGLLRGGDWLVEPPASSSGYFVKPNRLGAKIGIWADSRIGKVGDALALGLRVFDAYRDEVIVQPYVAGRNVRASFLAVDPKVGPEALGIVFVDSGGDFQTMADSMALYGDTGIAARQAGQYVEPELVQVASVQPRAAEKIRQVAVKLMAGLGLRDVFSLDFRVEADDTVHLIEFEVCPGLPCFDFRAYCRTEWQLGLVEAMAETAARRLMR